MKAKMDGRKGCKSTYTGLETEEDPPHAGHGTSIVIGEKGEEEEGIEEDGTSGKICSSEIATLDGGRGEEGSSRISILDGGGDEGGERISSWIGEREEKW